MFRLIPLTRPYTSRGNHIRPVDAVLAGLHPPLCCHVAVFQETVGELCEFLQLRDETESRRRARETADTEGAHSPHYIPYPLFQQSCK